MMTEPRFRNGRARRERADVDVRIWALGFGYFLFYIPYSALAKALSDGLLGGSRTPVAGLEILPVTVLGTALTMPLIITLLGWWKYAGRRRVLGYCIPCPGGPAIRSGAAFAVIIATTTLAYTFNGISIVFALILMRGGVLILAPLVDTICGRKVHWYSWIALALSLAAVGIALSEVGARRNLSIVAMLNLAAYLTGYLFRLRTMTRNAKSIDEYRNRRYFVEENIAAMVLLVAVPALMALAGVGQLRYGFTSFPGSALALPALLAGIFYGCLGVFGTLIYLDRRENTFTIPVNRSSSLLAGLLASYLLFALLSQKPVGSSQIAGAGVILLAVLSLNAPLLLGTAEGVGARLFIFVCSGNTSRSPMAEAICRAEIAARLNISIEALAGAGIEVLSAGLNVKPGSPLAPDALRALEHVGVPAFQHAARNLTPELVERATRVFCMTEDQRRAIVDRYPSIRSRVFCLHPDADLADPSGSGQEAFRRLAAQLQMLVRIRLDGLGLEFSGEHI